MQVLLTGGGGFIGSHLSDALIEDGHEVIAVDNFCSSNRRNVEHLQDEDSFRLIEQDILDPLSLEGKFDYVLHFASRASPKDYQQHPIHTLRTNSEGTLKLLEIAEENNAKFLYASTSEVYGDPKVHPQTEDYWGHVNPNGPRACYDEAKRFGEAAVTSFARKHDLDWRIIRIFNTYGPRMRADDGRVVSNFITQALNDEPLTVYGDGKQTRSFCYIDDLVRGVHAAMGGKSREVFNLGNPDECTVKDLAGKIQELTNINTKIVHKELPQDDPERRKPDISKAKKELGWEPEISIERGMSRTIDYFTNLLHS